MSASVLDRGSLSYLLGDLCASNQALLYPSRRPLATYWKPGQYRR